MVLGTLQRGALFVLMAPQSRTAQEDCRVAAEVVWETERRKKQTSK
jgi:hypothetical protein